MKYRNSLFLHKRAICAKHDGYNHCMWHISVWCGMYISIAARSLNSYFSSLLVFLTSSFSCYTFWICAMDIWGGHRSPFGDNRRRNIAMTNYYICIHDIRTLQVLRKIRNHSVTSFITSFSMESGIRKKSFLAQTQQKIIHIVTGLGKLTFQLWSVCLIAVIQSQCIWKVKGYVMLTVVDVWLTSARLILLDAIAWVMWHTERTSHGECSKEKEKKERRKKLNTDNLTDQID